MLKRGPWGDLDAPFIVADRLRLGMAPDRAGGANVMLAVGI